MTYSSCFVIFIPDKTTTSDVSWHQMDTRLTRFVLDTRLVLETRLIFKTRLLLEQVTKTPACNVDPASIWDPACIRSFTVSWYDSHSWLGNVAECQSSSCQDFVTRLFQVLLFVFESVCCSTSPPCRHFLFPSTDLHRLLFYYLLRHCDFQRCWKQWCKRLG